MTELTSWDSPEDEAAEERVFLRAKAAAEAELLAMTFGELIKLYDTVELPILEVITREELLLPPLVVRVDMASILDALSNSLADYNLAREAEAARDYAASAAWESREEYLNRDY